MKSTRWLLGAAAAVLVPLLGSCASGGQGGDPYAGYVWPAPPDKPRIRLTGIYSGRDVESGSTIKRLVWGRNSKPYDWLQKPIAVAFDRQGRILVTDQGLAAILRFDRAGRRLDVFGTQGNMRLTVPLGLDVGNDGTILVADAGLKAVVAYTPEGDFARSYGRPGELKNPTDAAFSKDGTRIFVTDSKAHRVVVYDAKSGAMTGGFGQRGTGDGEFNFPSSICVDAEGNLFVVDQGSARVQILTPEGEFLDQFGGRSVAYGGFVRPKDVAVDEAGLVYVPDAAFNNVQVFNADLQLLMFFGAGGTGPGMFQIPSAIAVRGDEIVVADQLNRRIQLFRFVAPKTGD